MNVYNNLNEMLDYIECHLTEEIDYKKLASLVGLNVYTLQRLFPLLCDISLNEYIRKRRLTLAGKDLIQDNLKVIDVAVKYGYTSASSFSRAFFAFHGIKPSRVKENVGKLKYFPKLKLEPPKMEEELVYEVVQIENLTLYGIGIKTNQEKIKRDAPKLFQDVEIKYPEIPHPDYGMVVYEDRFNSGEYEYWVLWENKYLDFDKKTVKASKYLKFRINSSDARDIQEMANNFYLKFLPTCKYSLKEEPELEYYHDGVVDFLIPIN